jgi:acyl-CoA reductase-like NAD-dependent aldehyde dehydrogenase
MATLVSTSPDNVIGVVGEVEISSEIEVNAAVSAAREAFGKWGLRDLTEPKVVAAYK